MRALFILSSLGQNINPPQIQVLPFKRLTTVTPVTVVTLF
jgi:hypothetical protein